MAARRDALNAVRACSRSSITRSARVSGGTLVPGLWSTTSIIFSSGRVRFTSMIQGNCGEGLSAGPAETFRRTFVVSRQYGLGRGPNGVSGHNGLNVLERRGI